GAVRCLFRVRVQVVGDGGIGADAYRVGRDRLLVLERDGAWRSAFHRGHVRSTVDVAAHRLDCRGETSHVLKRVKLALLREAKRRPGVEAGDRGAVDQADVD